MCRYPEALHFSIYEVARKIVGIGWKISNHQVTQWPLHASTQQPFDWVIVFYCFLRLSRVCKHWSLTLCCYLWTAVLWHSGGTRSSQHYFCVFSVKLCSRTAASPTSNARSAILYILVVLLHCWGMHNVKKILKDAQASPLGVKQ